MLNVQTDEEQHVITLVDHPDLLAVSDAARFWGVSLIDPQVPLARRIRDEDTMRKVFIEQPEWAAVFVSGVLSSLVQTLPERDPWRHLSARLPALLDDPDMVRDDVVGPPDVTGAVLPDGRTFGGSEHPRFFGVDPELDVEYAALSEGLSGYSAALFAFAADGCETARAALRLVRIRALTEATWAPGASDERIIAAHAGEQVWSTAEAALRWALHRRRQLFDAQSIDALMDEPYLPRGGTDEFARDLIWAWASYADQVIAGGPIHDADKHPTELVTPRPIGEPASWPGD